MSDTTRNDLKKLAANIENLARDMQAKLDANADVLVTANEMVRNNVTFTFTLGEFYANQQSSTAKKTKTPKTPQGPRNYHNFRINGRFARKV